MDFIPKQKKESQKATNLMVRSRDLGFKGSSAAGAREHLVCRSIGTQTRREFFDFHVRGSVDLPDVDNHGHSDARGVQLFGEGL